LLLLTIPLALAFLLVNPVISYGLALVWGAKYFVTVYTLYKTKENVALAILYPLVITSAALAAIFGAFYLIQSFLPTASIL
jgi:hypothetical protein